MVLFGLDFSDLATWTPATMLGLLQFSGEVLAILHIPSVLLRRASRPVAQLAWILLLIALPFAGVVLWWLMGRTHLDRKRRRRATARRAVTEQLKEIEHSDPPALQGQGPIQQSARVADDEIFPTTADNRVRLLVRGTQVYPEFERAIADATHHIHLVFYIWKRDEIGTRLRDLLIEKARAGVEVRLLYDAWGAHSLSFAGFMNPIREAGGKVVPFMPLRLERHLRVNFRNHRKIIICDGAVGFTGGLNIGDEYNEWYDMAAKVEGPVVNQLQEVFAEDWYFACGENIAEPEYFRGEPVVDDEEGHEDVIARVIASGPDSIQRITHTMFFLAITMAQERIWITTPYFIPDAAIITALRTAVIRGVDVRLLLPGQSDVWIAQAAGRGYFAELLEAGVRIWEYQPNVLHAKVLVVDHYGAVVGSSNMDTRSFRLQFEVNLAIESPIVNQELATEFEARLAESEEISFERWSRRSMVERFGDAAARLMSPVL